MLIERVPCRYVGFFAASFMVVGLSFKPENETTLEFDNRNIHFQIGDIDKPIDILAALHISEQKILQ